jgi:chromosome segregation ATPase
VSGDATSPNLADGVTGALSQYETDLAGVERLLGELHERASSARAEAVDTAQQISTALARLDQLRAEVIAEEARLEALTARRHSLTTEVDRLNREKEAARNEFLAMRDDLADLVPALSLLNEAQQTVSRLLGLDEGQVDEPRYLTVGDGSDPRPARPLGRILGVDDDG